MAEVVPLETRGGGSSSTSGAGGSGSGTDYVVPLIDEKMGRMKAELKIELREELEPIRLQLSKVVPGWTGYLTVIGTVIGAIFTAMGIILAVLAFAGDRFDGGMSASGALTQQAYDAERRASELNRKIDCLIRQQQNPAHQCGTQAEENFSGREEASREVTARRTN